MQDSLDVATDVLEVLWKNHCGTLLGCTFRDQVVTDVWKQFQDSLRRSALVPSGMEYEALGGMPPVELWESVNGASLVPVSSSSSAAGGGPTRLVKRPPSTAQFLLRMSPQGADGTVIQESLVAPLLQDTEKTYLRDVPLTVLPILEFLRAVIAFHQFQSITSPSPSSSAPKPTAATTSVHRTLFGGRSERVALDTRSTRLTCCIVQGSTTPYAAVTSHTLNKFVFLRGTVVRLSTPMVQCMVMAFRCASCGAVQNVPLDGGVLQYPTSCRGSRCQSRLFHPYPEQAICEELQLVKMQETSAAGEQQQQHFAVDPQQQQGANPSSSGGVAKMMEVELRGAAMNSVTAGEVVLVGGIVSTRRAAAKASAVGATRQLCLVGNSILSVTGSARRAQRTKSALTTSVQSEKAAQFYAMAQHGKVWFDRLCTSLCPNIVGMHAVKAALLLALLGGTDKPMSRARIHCLIVGDPGLGKSQLLRAACAVAPRSSFVCATTSSSCGLTVTLARDPSTGETTFEAGAVVHGDGGITCIDELDKGVGDHKALLEVMEQESISIAKAGMVFSMPVKTSILAAGNPVGGKFQPHKPISENLNMNAALLSRFDFIFLLKDELRGGVVGGASLNGNNRRGGGDVDITRHVLSLHRVADSRSSTDSSSGGTVAPLPLPLISQFLHFARETCHPSLTPDATSILRDAYLEERKLFSQCKTDLPVTPRFLQALIRASEAKAKAELRHQVSAEDATYAVTLMRACTASYREHSPAAAMVDGIPLTKSVQKKLTIRDQALLHLAQRLETKQNGEGLSHSEAVECCAEVPGVKNGSALLQQLNEVGLVLLSGGRYRVKRSATHDHKQWV